MLRPLERAVVSLEGLSVGDALGQRFFSREIATAYGPGNAPEAPWWWTDDTNMALSIVETLAMHGCIDQDALADNFHRRFDPGRQYGAGMYELLPRLGGETWRQLAPALFDASGSFGNGAAMRVAPLGAFFADDLDSCVAEAERSAVVTHAHPEGVAGAVAVAVAAALATAARGGPRPELEAFLAQVAELTPPGEVRDGVRRVADFGPTASVSSIVRAVGNGSRVSAQDTAPFALWCAARHLDDFEGAVWAAISGGGDIDTIAAIVGGTTAGYVGAEGIPSSWRTAREPLPDLSGLADGKQTRNVDGP